jgi:arylsulfatase A-like enzyme
MTAPESFSRDRVFAVRVAAVPLGVLAAVELLAYAPLQGLLAVRIWLVHGIVTCLAAVGVLIVGALITLAARRAGHPGLPSREVTFAVSLGVVVAAHVAEPMAHRAPEPLTGVPMALRVGVISLVLVGLYVPIRRYAAGKGQGLRWISAPLVALVAVAILAGAAVKASGAWRDSPTISRPVLVASALLGGWVVVAGLCLRRRQICLLAASVAVGLVVLRVSLTNPHDWMEWEEPPSEPADRAPVLLISLDTFRADALDLSTPENSTTPRLSAFSKRSDVYSNAIANASWTLPGHASLFTGRTLAHHATDATGRPGFAHQLRDEIPTVHELLSASGYRTTCITANPIIGFRTGLARGSQRYCNPGRMWMASLLPWRLLGIVSRSHLAMGQLRVELTGIEEWATAAEIVDRAIEEIDRGQDPQYLFLNFMDVHPPIFPPGELLSVPLSQRLAFRSDLALRFLGASDETTLASRHRATLRSYYAGRARRLDAELGRLFDALEARGWLDKAAVVISADHGEAFGENPALLSYFYHHSAYEPAVRIPLLVKRAGQRGASRHEQLVQQADVLPILLDAVGLPVPDGLDGASPGAPRDGPILTEWYERLGDESFPVVPHHRLALYQGRFKYVLEGDGMQYLYDLERSPYEEVDVIDDHPKLVAELRERLLDATRVPPELAGDGSHAMDADLLEQMRGLGYVE